MVFIVLFYRMILYQISVFVTLDVMPGLNGKGRWVTLLETWY